MSSQVSGQVPEEIINAMHSMMAQTVPAGPAQIARHNFERLRNQAVHGAVGVIMSPPLTLAAGTSVEVLHPSHLLGQGLLIPGEIDTPAKVDPAPTPRRVPMVDWLDEIAFFIPKSIREPFLGDLREDMVSKAAQGHSQASVWWAAISQVAIFATWWTWSNLVRGSR